MAILPTREGAASGVLSISTAGYDAARAIRHMLLNQEQVSRGHALLAIPDNP